MRKKRKQKFLGNQISEKTLVILFILLFFVSLIATGHGWLAVLILLLIISPLVITRYRKRNKRKQIIAAMLEAGSTNPMQLSPETYERFCAELLSNNGWKTELTAKSGDYGADVIATKNGRRIVLQCKQWTNSVGVKAVQEVHASASYYGAHQAFVVSTARYTAGARNLAARTGVSLLSHVDLINLI